MKSRWAPVFLVVALMIATVATAVLYAGSQPDVYTSRAILALTPRNPAKLGATNLRLATSRYTTALSSESLLGGVAADTGFSTDVITEATKVSVQPNTTIITITVSLEQADRVAAVANAVATTGLRLSRTDGLILAELVAPGVTPQSAGGPNRKLIALTGIGIAVVAGALASAALGFFRTTEVKWSSARRPTHTP